MKSGGKRVLAPVDKGGKILFRGRRFRRRSPRTTCRRPCPPRTHPAAVRGDDALHDRAEHRGHGKGARRSRRRSWFSASAPATRGASPSLNAVYLKDYNDALYKSKIDNTTIIGISCAKCDEYCFCTSVGGSPGDTDGSDILLTRDRRRHLPGRNPHRKGQGPGRRWRRSFRRRRERGQEQAPRRREGPVRPHRRWRKSSPASSKAAVWITQSLRCIGCGTCSYVCPACTCFDIQDETDGEPGRPPPLLGLLRASGSSPCTPRGTIPARCRASGGASGSCTSSPTSRTSSRSSGCVGCGRCSRACPVDMNILQHIKDILEAR